MDARPQLFSCSLHDLLNRHVLVLDEPLHQRLMASLGFPVISLLGLERGPAATGVLGFVVTFLFWDQ